MREDDFLSLYFCKCPKEKLNAAAALMSHYMMKLLVRDLGKRKKENSYNRIHTDSDVVSIWIILPAHLLLCDSVL